jgi:serine/threonine protein phosphatase PrpC
MGNEARCPEPTAHGTKRGREPPVVTFPAKMPSLVGFAQEQHRGDQDRHQMCMLGDVEFYAVYDGSGGFAAAEYLRDHFHVRFADALQGVNFAKESAMRKLITSVFKSMDEEMNQKFKGTETGSTASIALIKATRCYFAHVGDSPIVFKSKGRSRKPLRYYAEPHTYENVAVRKQIGEQHFKDERLFGILQPVRMFGGMDMKAKDEHKDSKGSWILSASSPTIWTCDVPGSILLASDGVLQGMKKGEVLDIDLPVEELMERAHRNEAALSWIDVRLDDITIIRIDTKSSH